MLKRLAKYLHSTIGWGICYEQPKFLSHLPEGKDYVLDNDESNPSPVDINKPILKCFVDASRRSDLRRTRSITGLVYTYC